MSAPAAFVAVPPSWPMKTSSPRRLGSVLTCGSIATCWPAARIVCPSGVEIVPSLLTFGPTRAMRPPTCSGVVGLESCAPFCTTTPPLFPSGVFGGGGGVNAGIVAPLGRSGMASDENIN